MLKYARLQLAKEEDIYIKTRELTSRYALSHNDIGMAYSMNGLFEDALMPLNRSINTRQKLSGFRKDWLFNPLYHLGLCYMYQGDNGKATSYLQRAIDDRVEIFGPDDRESTR